MPDLSYYNCIVLFLTICSCIFLYLIYAILTLMKAVTLLPKHQHLYNKLFLCRNPGIHQYTYIPSDDDELS